MSAAPVKEEVRRPLNPKVEQMKNPHPGHCRTCDVAVPPRGRSQPQYCDEHRPPKGRPPRKPPQKAEPVDLSRPPTARDVVHALPSPPKRVTAEATSKFFGTVIFYLALFVVMGFVDRAVPDEPEERKEAYVAELQLTKDNATAISRPIARYLAPTGLWQRVGPALVGNTDAIDALVVLYEWTANLVRFRRRAARGGSPAPSSIVEPASNGAGWHASATWGNMPTDADIAAIRRAKGAEQ